MNEQEMLNSLVNMIDYLDTTSQSAVVNWLSMFSNFTDKENIVIPRKKIADKLTEIKNNTFGNNEQSQKYIQLLTTTIENLNNNKELDYDTYEDYNEKHSDLTKQEMLRKLKDIKLSFNNSDLEREIKSAEKDIENLDQDAPKDNIQQLIKEKEIEVENLKIIKDNLIDQTKHVSFMEDAELVDGITPLRIQRNKLIDELNAATLKYENEHPDFDDDNWPQEYIDIEESYDRLIAPIEKEIKRLEEKNEEERNKTIFLRKSPEQTAKETEDYLTAVKELETLKSQADSKSSDFNKQNLENKEKREQLLRKIAILEYMKSYGYNNGINFINSLKQDYENDAITSDQVSALLEVAKDFNKQSKKLRQHSEIASMNLEELNKELSKLLSRRTEIMTSVPTLSMNERNSNKNRDNNEFWGEELEFVSLSPDANQKIKDEPNITPIASTIDSSRPTPPDGYMYSPGGILIPRVTQQKKSPLHKIEETIGNPTMDPRSKIPQNMGDIPDGTWGEDLEYDSTALRNNQTKLEDSSNKKENTFENWRYTGDLYEDGTDVVEMLEPTIVPSQKSEVVDDQELTDINERLKLLEEQKRYLSTKKSLEDLNKLFAQKKELVSSKNIKPTVEEQKSLPIIESTKEKEVEEVKPLPVIESKKEKDIEELKPLPIIESTKEKEVEELKPLPITPINKDLTIKNEKQADDKTKNKVISWFDKSKKKIVRNVLTALVLVTVGPLAALGLFHGFNCIANDKGLLENCGPKVEQKVEEEEEIKVIGNNKLDIDYDILDPGDLEHPEDEEEIEKPVITSKPQTTPTPVTPVTPTIPPVTPVTPTIPPVTPVTPTIPPVTPITPVVPVTPTPVPPTPTPTPVTPTPTPTPVPPTPVPDTHEIRITMTIGNKDFWTALTCGNNKVTVKNNKLVIYNVSNPSVTQDLDASVLTAIYDGEKVVGYKIPDNIFQQYSNMTINATSPIISDGYVQETSGRSL